MSEGRSRDQGRLKGLARNIGEGGALGAEIVSYLRQPEVLSRLRNAADAGLVPAATVTDGLLSKFGSTQLAPHTVHRFIGTAIRALLEDEGFEVDLTGVRTPRNPLFASASTFRRRRAAIQPAEGSLIKRLLESLTQEELDQIAAYIEERKRRGTRT